jgi:Esterase PHB depolymerase
VTGTAPRRSLLAAALISLPILASAGDLPAGAAGAHRDVVFTEYSALSSSAEMASRLLTPLAYAALLRKAADMRRPLQGQPIDLARERFTVYVPAVVPPQGYSLLVFIPPWREAVVPSGWAAVLDDHGMIFVSAANSGNDANVLDRRIPLALLAAANVMHLYPIDRERVYVGGFSGGSRVAMRMALSFPDVFHGALLNAGSDPIGEASASLPAADLFRRFQSASRLVYVTGIDDRLNIDDDNVSRQSMRDWCVFGTSEENVLRAGHEAAVPPSFDRALSRLLEQAQPDAGKLADCRARIDAQLQAKLAEAKAAMDRDDARNAWRLLNKIDARYGGLAAPASLDLAERIEARR